ncbi:MAG: sugar phosphate isomerase/epimerase [Cytophagales bacterium]|nr:sugar phosphate isomerase/epimerase [Cytophagales bacterium]
MVKRRNFVKTTSIAASGSLIFPAVACSQKDKKSKELNTAPPEVAKRMEPGLQVYSVRNQLKEDFAGSMKKIADIGYKLIEGYGLGLDGKFLGTISPGDYKKTVSDLGMKLVASHCGYFKHEDASGMIDAAKRAGLEYLIIPGIPGDIRKTIDDYKAIADNFNRIGEQCKAAGLKFGYHNHAFEFEVIDGQLPQEVLMAETQTDLVAFEADLFWCYVGGYDAVKLIEKFPGKVHLFHVKDATPEKREATVGQGVIDFKSIFDAGKASGLRYYFVEDERTDDPFANVRADYDYMIAQDFA